MKRITVYNINLVEKIEEIIRDLCFIVVDTNKFIAEMSDEYYQTIKEDLFDTINQSGYTQYDYMVEDI